MRLFLFALRKLVTSNNGYTFGLFIRSAHGGIARNGRCRLVAGNCPLTFTIPVFTIFFILIFFLFHLFVSSSFGKGGNAVVLYAWSTPMSFCLLLSEFLTSPSSPHSSLSYRRSVLNTHLFIQRPLSFVRSLFDGLSLLSSRSLSLPTLWIYSTLAVLELFFCFHAVFCTRHDTGCSLFLC